MAETLYHVVFGAHHLPEGTAIALLSGDPARSELIAMRRLADGRELARHRGLDSFELVQAGIRTIIRVGTSGSIRHEVGIGSVVIPSGALTNQGAADDIAPPQFPAVADPFLAVELANAAAALDVEHHVGVVASVDTFYEGQERTTSSANPHLLRRLRGMIDEYHDLGVLSFEMEAGTLFKMGAVYGFAAGCSLAIVAQRKHHEGIHHQEVELAVDRAIDVAVRAADAWSQR